MNKGYPRTRFEIVDQSGQQEVATATTAESMPLAMATYTSDKGSEDWKVYTTLDSFLKDTGSVSFAKHGQPQLTVAELLRNGAAVFCKRLVSNDASLANSTVYARIVRIAHKNEVAAQPAVTEGPFQHAAVPAQPEVPVTSYVYFYTKNIVGAVNFEDACTQAYDANLINIIARRVVNADAQSVLSSLSAAISKVAYTDTADDSTKNASNVLLVNAITSSIVNASTTDTTTDIIASIVDAAKTEHVTNYGYDTETKVLTDSDLSDALTNVITEIKYLPLADGEAERTLRTASQLGTVINVISAITAVDTLVTDTLDNVATNIQLRYTDNTIEDIIEVPLFTVGAKGRGISKIKYQLEPVYANSKASTYIRYLFNVYEGEELLESITFTMNPDIIIDGVSQAMNPKIKANSNQVEISMYEDSLLAFAEALTATATYNGAAMTLPEIINIDIINGLDRRGKTNIGGIVTAKQSVTDNTSGIRREDGYDLWTSFRPTNEEVIDITSGYYIPLENGSYGSMGDTPIGESFQLTGEYPATYVNMLLDAYGATVSYINSDGEYDEDMIQEDQSNWPILFDPIIYDLDAYKIDYICDCAYPIAVKNAIINLIDYRQDMIFFADLGLKANNIAAMRKMVEGYQDTLTGNEVDGIQKSRFVALYHNYFKIYNPYDSRQITVTLPYLLGIKAVKHIANGVGRPFAGILNGITFPEIISKSINFLPVPIPGWDQKQDLVDLNINYLSIYNETPVLETMYINYKDFTHLSFLHNIMGIQEVIKQIRTRCPKVRYAFLDTTDLKRYIDECNAVLNQYSTFFNELTMEYAADERYEDNNIFYAIIRVRFKNFIQEEQFRVIAIS